MQTRGLTIQRLMVSFYINTGLYLLIHPPPSSSSSSATFHLSPPWPPPFKKSSTFNHHHHLMMAKVLAVEQLNQLREIFDRFDMDSDGSLTYLELGALLRSIGLKLSGDQLYMLFNNMDSNGNGAVEFEELVSAMSIDMKTEEILINQRQLLEAFHSFDRDGNGFITPAQLAKSMAKMGQPLTYRELTAMVEEADLDGDGVINFNEFSSIMAKSAANMIFGVQVS